MPSKINKVFSRPRVVEDFDIYITGPLEDPSDYIEEFQSLNEAVEGSYANLYINTPGGRVDTAVQYLSKMSTTKAVLTAHIEGVCQSAGTYLFLAADNWVVHENTLMMIHNYSGGAYGKGKEVLENAKANDVWVRGLMNSVYEGFLTEEEIEDVNKNQDIWLTSSQIEERLPNLIAFRAAKLAAQEEDLKTKLELQIKEYTENVTENTEGIQSSTS